MVNNRFRVEMDLKHEVSVQTLDAEVFPPHGALVCDIWNNKIILIVQQWLYKF